MTRHLTRSARHGVLAWHGVQALASRRKGMRAMRAPCICTGGTRRRGTAHEAMPDFIFFPQQALRESSFSQNQNIVGPYDVKEDEVVSRL
jgi:hypothetical protein